MKSKLRVKDLDLLGLRVKDKVTGFTGVVTTVGYDLYGCVQVIVSAGIDEKGDMKDGRWFDSKRLDVVEGIPVMEVPNFIESQEEPVAVPGPARKPPLLSLPLR